jgi:hypothetical protein
MNLHRRIMSVPQIRVDIRDFVFIKGVVDTDDKFRIFIDSMTPAINLSLVTTTPVIIHGQ